jgi:hypothetical protein
MALLDVSSVLLDPDFTELVTIKRRAQTDDGHGRIITVDTIYPNIVAVLCAASPEDLTRETDYGAFMRSIRVVLQFRIRGQTEGYLPDVVVWRGNNFIVDSFDPYPQFGNGFYQAICQSMDRNDNAMELVLNGQLAFNNKTNSGNYYPCY